jgi:hypothetical protein
LLLLLLLLLQRWRQQRLTLLPILQNASAAV